MIKRSIEENIILWDYGKLSIMGVLGRFNSNRSLEDLTELGEMGFDVAPIKKETKRDVLAAIYFNPPIDFTIVKLLYKDFVSVVSFSLNKNENMEILKTFMEKARYISTEPYKEFIEEIEEGFGAEIAAYHKCILISMKVKCDLERVFGAIRYCNFLHQYKGYSGMESLTMAIEQYNLPEIKAP